MDEKGGMLLQFSFSSTLLLCEPSSVAWLSALRSLLSVWKIISFEVTTEPGAAARQQIAADSSPETCQSLFSKVLKYLLNIKVATCPEPQRTGEMLTALSPCMSLCKYQDLKITSDGTALSVAASGEQ